MTGSSIVAAGRGRPLWPAAIFVAVMAGIGVLAYRGTQDLARTLRVRIESLASAEEQ
jgi:hypothetical protein